MSESVPVIAFLALIVILYIVVIGLSNKKNTYDPEEIVRKEIELEYERLKNKSNLNN